jgi:hypothetical protein
MSTVLMEHKEKMEQGTFKILYETLGKETKDVSEENEMVWCKFYYIRSAVHSCPLCAEDEETPSLPDVSKCVRNARVWMHAFKHVQQCIEQYGTTSEYAMLKYADVEDSRTKREYLEKEFDEIFFFDPNVKYNFFKVELLA